MKRAWAVLFAAVTLAGCRTAQPTTNPFLRTTVPPPATTPGLVVTPGTPYAQGISPPMVTTPAPPVVTTPAPVITQPVPVAPAMAPMAAPPIMPQGDKFRAPGGSYLFHQSSYESPVRRESQRIAGGDGASERVVVQACYAPPEDRPLTVMSSDGFIENPYVVRPRKIENPQAISRDGYIENPFVKPKTLAIDEPDADRPTLAEPRRVPSREAEPPPKLAEPATRKPRPLAPARNTAPVAKKRAPVAAKPHVARITVDAPAPLRVEGPSKVSVSAAGQGNALRILGESVGPAEGAPMALSTEPSETNAGQLRTAQTTPTPGSVVLRITAGSPEPGLRSLSSTIESHASEDGTSADRSVDRAMVANGVGGGSTASFVTPDSTEQPIVQATFLPTTVRHELTRYAHAPDYGTLRGRLEFSPSQRQWKLRYIPIDGESDRYGGSVVLPTSPAVERFQPGDFVVVQGTLLREQGSAASFAPRYQPTTIERAAP